MCVDHVSQVSFRVVSHTVSSHASVSPGLFLLLLSCFVFSLPLVSLVGVPAANGGTAAAAKEITAIVTVIVIAIGTAAAGETGVTVTVTVPVMAAPPAALEAGTGNREGMM